MIGRYWAMDRDKRWDRIEAGVRRARVSASGARVGSALEAVQRESTTAGITDEFVEPTLIAVTVSARRRSVTIHDGDVVVFANFRPDRVRRAVTTP